MDAGVDRLYIRVMWVRGGFWDSIFYRRQRKMLELFDNILRPPRVGRGAMSVEELC